MSLKVNDKVPAKYVGTSERILPKEHGPYFDGDGKPWSRFIENLAIAEPDQMSPGIIPGNTIMLTSKEVYGQTYWHDLKFNRPSILVGVGRCCLPEDKGKTWPELVALGYEYHAPSPDFEMVYPLTFYFPQQPAAAPAATELVAPQPESMPTIPALLVPVTPVPKQEEEIITEE